MTFQRGGYDASAHLSFPSNNQGEARKMDVKTGRIAALVACIVLAGSMAEAQRGSAAAGLGRPRRIKPRVWSCLTR